MNAMLQVIAEEMEKSERRLMQIELFGDCIMITGVKAGQTAADEERRYNKSFDRSQRHCYEHRSPCGDAFTLHSGFAEFRTLIWLVGTLLILHIALFRKRNWHIQSYFFKGGYEIKAEVEKKERKSGNL
ncbi:MAG: hypothetical protein ACI4J3_00515 [Oscillospiraceae bacterium]